MLDPIAVGIFARNGIALVEVVPRDYVWTHNVYLTSEPPVQDLHVEIHERDYMGPVVYRETISRVHYQDAAYYAERVLTKFKEGKK